MIYDALIIGGGPAGTTTGWLLAKSGWNVALMEKSIFPRNKVCGEFISATSLPLLRKLGLDEYYLDIAGPPVREVGLYCGSQVLTAPMPVLQEEDACWGRALGREFLDSVLLLGAQRAGVNVIQPCSATGLERDSGLYVCTAKQPGKNSSMDIHARVVIAAHGSWEKGKLPTNIYKRQPRSNDLMAFKVHFINADLPAGQMPLLAFPGGYGGMVRSDHGRVSFSCCIRRDKLHEIRNSSGTYQYAAEAVFEHILENCIGVQHALRNAKTVDPWLGTGPIQPGIRTLYKDGIFAVGNTAGEAHPVVAEGISMAMQGGWLLSEILQANHAQLLRGETAQAGRVYDTVWKQSFARRINNAALFANLAMRPAVSGIILPLFKQVPELLTCCTRLSGKTTMIIPAYT